jgi:hypothetical protein
MVGVSKEDEHFLGYAQGRIVGMSRKDDYSLMYVKGGNSNSLRHV